MLKISYKGIKGKPHLLYKVFVLLMRSIHLNTTIDWHFGFPIFGSEFLVFTNFTQVLSKRFSNGDKMILKWRNMLWSVNFYFIVFGVAICQMVKHFDFNIFFNNNFQVSIRQRTVPSNVNIESKSFLAIGIVWNHGERTWICIRIKLLLLLKLNS